MAAESKESSKPMQNEFLPLSTLSAKKRGYVIKMAYVISKVADELKWFKHEKCRKLNKWQEFAQFQGIAASKKLRKLRQPIANRCSNPSPMGARRGQPGKAPPVDTKVKPASFKEVDIYITSQGIGALGGIGDI